MNSILIIGYGNPVCGDDGVAWHIVEALSPSLPDGAVHAIHQLTPEWAGPVSRVEHVIFVDAAVDGAPGEVRCIPISPASKRLGSHEMTPDGLMGMALALYGECPPAHLVTVTGGSFALSESLSEKVATAVPEAVRIIFEAIDKENCRGVRQHPRQFTIESIAELK